MKRLTRVARVDGVDVYLHWSTLLFGGLLLASSLPHVQMAVVVIGAYLGVLMVHEWGHVIAARRRGCSAWSIEIYPIVGLTRFSAPASYFDDCVIAWGGVLAQLALGAPLIAWVSAFGFTSSEQTNAVIVLLGYFSVFIAFVNLLPVSGLDGSKAWPLVPMLVSRMIKARLQRTPKAASRGRKKKWTH
jgi:Zn-dependent protease